MNFLDIDNFSTVFEKYGVQDRRICSFILGPVKGIRFEVVGFCCAALVGEQYMKLKKSPLKRKNFRK